MLLPHVKEWYKDYRNSIERSDSETVASVQAEPLPTPSWDPTLRGSKAQRYGLHGVLARIGLLGFCCRARARARFSFVKKNGGAGSA